MAFDANKPEYQSQILSQPLRDNFTALKTQLDVEHNENGTHKDTLKKSGDTATGEVGVKKSSPAIRLIGTEVNAQDLRIAESGGYLKIQKNLGTELIPAWSDIFSINASNYLLGTAKITHDNLDPTTQIPDGRLATITTAGKVASSALPTNLPTKDASNTFTQPQIVQGSDAGVYFDNNVDTTYKAEFKKDSDTTAKILIKKKSDGTDAAVYTYGADGNLTTKKLTAQTQLVSQIATGTPPLSVASGTLVPTLYVSRAARADVADVARTLTTTTTTYYASTTWSKPATGTLVIIEAWGGGGGGGHYGGGGAGQYIQQIIPFSAVPASVPITIGAGGGVVSGYAIVSGEYAGYPGGATTFGAYARASGGAGGVPSSYVAGESAVLGGAGGAEGVAGSAPGGGGGWGTVGESIGGVMPAVGGAGAVRITVM